MKAVALIVAATRLLATCAVAEDFHPAPLTSDDAAVIRQELESYEKGKIDLFILTDDTPRDQKLISYYLSDTNAVSLKKTLAISRAYSILEINQEAARLATNYLRVYSNDWRGWHVLAAANLSMSNVNEAFTAYSNAARFGDEHSFAPLTGLALQTDRLDIISNMVPHLLELKDKNPVPEDGHLDLVALLTAYALKSNREDVFVKALEGLDASDVASRTDLSEMVKHGCEEFKGKDIDRIRNIMGIVPKNDSK